MEAGKRTIRDIFNRGRNLEIPFFQRAYVWDTEQWQRFLEDMRMVSTTQKPYFLGSVILILLLESHREGMADSGCNKKAWDSGKAPAGCSINMASTVSAGNVAIGGSCSQDKDCLPGQKTCQNTKSAAGTPKKCATKSVCAGGKCEVKCQEGECPDDTNGALSSLQLAALKASKIHEAGSDEQFVGDMREGYTSTRIPLRPHSFPVTGTDQISMDRMFKLNALHAKNAASQQANGCTNNGGGIAF